MEKNDLTTGSIGKTLMRFSLPFLFSCFLQTFYGMADLYVAGRYNGSETTAAVSSGSQIMHMITVIIVGLTMGITVCVGRAAGEKNNRAASSAVGAAALFFTVFSVAASVFLVFFSEGLVKLMLTPQAAVEETIGYLRICIAGVPFIMVYNIISSIFRGMGDSKRPMFFVGIACVTNILLDFLFVGAFGMGARGAALATIAGQAVSAVTAFLWLKNSESGFFLKKEHLRFDKKLLFPVLKTGVPVAMQDGFIQIAFITLTVIANTRGLVAATAVGIVEKLIGFMFLVPSAMLSAISAITAQNMGAGNRKRAVSTLKYGLMITTIYGAVCSVYNQFLPNTLIRLFTDDAAVLEAACQYMRSYAFDVMFAGMHFCFSGFFCGDSKSGISFLHNVLSIILMRIPGAYLAARLFPDTLWHMGLAAPLGSLLSVIICACAYVYYSKRQHKWKGW